MSNPWDELREIDDKRAQLWDLIESLEQQIDDLQAQVDRHYASLDRLDNQEWFLEGKIVLMERKGTA